MTTRFLYSSYPHPDSMSVSRDGPRDTRTSSRRCAPARKIELQRGTEESLHRESAYRSEELKTQAEDCGIEFSVNQPYCNFPMQLFAILEIPSVPGGLFIARDARYGSGGLYLPDRAGLD